MTAFKSLTLGRRIQALRNEQALTQDALAERMDVSRSAILSY